MRVIVIGSGLIGLTTAWFLSKDGHEVSVIDRAAGPGLETSFANGALLTPSMAEPWNSPGVWRALVSSLGHDDAPVQLHLRVIPALSRWGMQFLRNSRVRAFERNSTINLKLAMYSLQAMRLLRGETEIEYARTALGSLRIFRDRDSLEVATAAAVRNSLAGLKFRILSSSETIDIEPTLNAIGEELVGAIHYIDDEVGDAYQFSVELAEILKQRGVSFHFDTEILALESHSGRISGAVSAQERFEADQYVVAAGSYSAPLLRSCRIQIPTQPVKGYSISFEQRGDCPPLHMPVIDDRLHAVAVPVGGTIRVAGTAEFAGFDLLPNPVRIENLVRLLRTVFPSWNVDRDNGKSWCGLRSVSSDGVPIIGPTRVPNLMVNTGHGHLGWTMAAGSAQLLASSMSQTPISLDPAPFSPARF